MGGAASASTNGCAPSARSAAATAFANMACFLASDAGSYINGAAINVDGGLCKVV
ncbi:MAG: SDR family oxidoreductase [Rhodospirillales bacterium]